MVQACPAFEKRGPHLSMGRWFGWHDCAEYHDSSWHSNLLVYIFQGLQRGWLSALASELSMAVPKVEVHVGAEPKKESTSKTRATMDKVRGDCTNMLHVSILVLRDPRAQNRARLLAATDAPIRRCVVPGWHHNTRRGLPSLARVPCC